VKGQVFFDRAIVGLFNVVGKITGGQLVLTAVVGDAFAADPFARAGVVGAITVFFINLGLAFHRNNTSVQVLNRS
jgi:hypothetical protein